MKKRFWKWGVNVTSIHRAKISNREAPEGHKYRNNIYSSSKLRPKPRVGTMHMPSVSWMQREVQSTTTAEENLRCISSFRKTTQIGVPVVRCDTCKPSTHSIEANGMFLFFVFVLCITQSALCAPRSIGLLKLILMQIISVHLHTTKNNNHQSTEICFSRSQI